MNWGIFLLIFIMLKEIDLYFDFRLDSKDFQEWSKGAAGRREKKKERFYELKHNEMEAFRDNVEEFVLETKMQVNEVKNLHLKFWECDLEIVCVCVCEYTDWNEMCLDCVS